MVLTDYIPTCKMMKLESYLIQHIKIKSESKAYM